MPHNHSKTTWLLIADGAGAQVYVVTFAPLHIEKLANGALKDPHHGMHNPELRRPQEEKFAAHVAKFVNEAADRNEFAKLIVVAPPRALAELRNDLSAPVHGKIWTEVSAEWSKLSIPDIITHLKDKLPLAAET